MYSKKTKKIDVRLTAKEKEEIQQQAKKYNMNTSQYIRFICEMWRICENGHNQSSTNIEVEG